MSADKEKITLIEDFLNQRLEGKELEHFRKLMSQDPDFEEEIIAHRMAEAIVIDYGLIQLKNKMAHEYRHRNYQKVQYWRLYAIAAAVLILSAIGFWYTMGHESKYSSPTKVKNQKGEGRIPSNTSTKSKNPSLPEAIGLNKQERNTPLVYQQNKNTKKPTGKALKKKVEKTKGEENPIPLKPIQPLSHTDSGEKLAETIATTAPKKLSAPCEALDIKALNISTEPTCENNKEGAIIISDIEITGGEIPYSFSIDGGLSYQKWRSFQELGKGSYNLIIRDAKGCSATWPRAINVLTKNCEKSLTFSFYPDAGEVWKFPIERESSGEMRIYNQGGLIVYESKIKDGFPNTWSGTGSNGSYYKMGVYTFIFINDNGTRIKGAVSILR